MDFKSGVDGAGRKTVKKTFRNASLQKWSGREPSANGASPGRHCEERERRSNPFASERGIAPLQLAIQQFGKDSGWVSFDRYPRTLADVNGDAMADIVGFGDAGTHLALASAFHVV